ncbi:MAG: sulfatase [Verrucomicrobia bacterium]|nr:sulfatase [Verrucomicrobiota bacterium]
MNTLRRCAAVVSLFAACAAAFAAAPPNIVLIISDDHAWTDYGFMGHPNIRTPNLDRLASQSLTFTRGYVPSSLCCPSLASIITGRYPHQHKVTSNDPPLPAGTLPRDFQKSDAFKNGREAMNRHMDAVPTLPRVLAQHGYLALQTGKWWQGPFSRGGFTHGMTKGNRHGDEGLDIGRKTMQPVFDFIETARKEKKPFFVWYAPMLPHTPHNPPERLLEKYRDKAPTPSVAKYWAMVEWFDETCGQLLDHLDRQGLAKDTVVAYVTDNGWIQQPDADRYAPKSKQSQYDGGLRTPIMIRWPDRVKAQKSASLASSVDLMPTLLAAAGVKLPAGLPGLNLLDPAAVGARTSIFGSCFTHNAVDLDNPAANLRWRWTIEGDWKLIVPSPRNEAAGVVELYNLKDDAHETTNRAATDKDRVAGMTKSLDAWWAGK